MLALPANPPHVLMPSEPELRDVNEPSGRWRPEDCPLCHGERQFIGWSPGSTTEYDVWACDCEEQLLLRRWMRVRGIGTRWGVLRWCDMVGVHQRVQEWATAYALGASANADLGIGAYLYGSSGSGKSAIAFLLAKTFLLHGIETFAIDGPNFLSRMQGWSDPEKLERFVTRLMNAPVLLVDELGKEGVSLTKEWERDQERNAKTRVQIERVFQHRIDERLTTIVTSNLSPDSMKAKFGSFVIESISNNGEVIDGSTPEPWHANERARTRAEAELNIRRPFTFT